MDRTYKTVAGDTWDSIAYAIYGDESAMTALQAANKEHLGTLMFGAGVELVVPDKEALSATSILPPWESII